MFAALYGSEIGLLSGARYIEREADYVSHRKHITVPFSKNGWKIIAGGIKC